MSLKEKIAPYIITATIIASYPLLQLPIQATTHLINPTINTKQAATYIQEQREKHNIEAQIELNLQDGIYEPHVTLNQGNYEIHVQETNLKKYLLSHEICHIKNNDLKETNTMKNLYINEPKTNICQFTNL